jgi:MFS family permease
LIPIHQGLSSAYVWLPVMVLFTRSRFGLGQALTISAIYYLSVVVLEVPSGWMSDRLGRVITLRLAAASWIVGQACFLIGDDAFALILAGQFFLAGGFASLSGTDVTFHYDTLEAVGRAIEYPARQARVASIGFGVTAVSAVIGGAVGYISLRAVFALALVLAVGQLVVALRLVEPPSEVSGAGVTAPAVDPGTDPGVGPWVGEPASEPAGAVGGEAVRAGGLGGQLRDCVGYLRHPFLGWIFAYGVAMVTLEHAAVSVLQPWLTELNDGTATDIGATPLLSGAVFAVVALVGAAAARSSEPLARRFGVMPTLLGLGTLSAIIVTSMAIWVAPVVLILIALRSAQGAAAPVLISDAVASRVQRHHRATLLSLNSLAGRLAWGLILLAVGRVVADDVDRSLTLLSLVAWLILAAITAWAVAIGRRRSVPAIP